jgi:E3 ubiquitin-protein ligase CCNP1IP1
LVVCQENLRQRNEELGQELREKNRKHKQTQELYDKLKHRDMLDQVQNAASDAIDHSIQASTAGHRFLEGPNLGRPQHLPLFPDQQGNKTQLSSHSIEGFVVPSMPPPIARVGPSDGWNPQKIQESNGRISTYTLSVSSSNKQYRA